MSKIQEALDKMKAGKGGAPAFTGGKPGQQYVRYHEENAGAGDGDYVNNIEDMYQPSELDEKEKDSLKIISPKNDDIKVVNAFRELRTVILQKIKETNPIILVTSCADCGGGSFVALNLATAFAMDETKTALLIDCNFDDYGITKLISNKMDAGLKEYLKGNLTDIKNIIYPTGIPRLRLIPAGSLNAAMNESFTGLRMRELFDNIQTRYSDRYILIDAPPISKSADARILAQVCDHVVLVVPYGKTTGEEVLTAARAIGKEKLLGTVFNNVYRLPKFSWL